MHYFEVWLADSKYRGETPLTYRFKEELIPLTVVSVPLRQRLVSGFVIKEVPKPEFVAKEIKMVLSQTPLPVHCFELANWLSQYYCVSLGEALRQFAPSLPSGRRLEEPLAPQQLQEDLRLDSKLTAEQISAITAIKATASTTVLLHGDTGSGKTRVYLELAQEMIDQGKSVILLTPEIGLTAQLARAADKLNCPIFILHSEMTPAKRKKAWFSILESTEPIVVIGPRSALFAPVVNPGLIVVDEAHEAAYKQEQSPRYHAVRVASQLGKMTDSKVILGSATPSVTDYYVASARKAVVRMRLQAKSAQKAKFSVEIIDLRNKNNVSKNRYISDLLINRVNQTLTAGKQSLIYYNRRGTSRLILCNNCGWQLACPNCDVPLIYHGDSHETRCHICGFKTPPPNICPVCSNNDVIYTSIGTKALEGVVKSMFANARVQRFDSDNQKGQRLNELFELVHSGQIDILVGTQLIAKGLDLPKLDLVGVVAAETSLVLPDYTAEERTFQLLYQVIGRVGRHSTGQVVIQTYNPDSFAVAAAAKRDYEGFYKKIITERQTYRFPPFSYLLKLVCQRRTENGARLAASNLKTQLLKTDLPIEVVGPSPGFHQRRGNYYFYQLVVRAKDRQYLVELARAVPAGWLIDLDPIDLL
jgi:primosomal protein N' (replication factor Y) (superfamily II helicase)